MFDQQIRLTTAGRLILLDRDGLPVGEPSGVLARNRWQRIEAASDGPLIVDDGQPTGLLAALNRSIATLAFPEPGSTPVFTRVWINGVRVERAAYPPMTNPKFSQVRETP